MPPSDPLARVKRATAKRRAIDREYRAALEAARNAGESVQAIARAAGISRQGVYKYLATCDEYRADEYRGE